MSKPISKGQKDFNKNNPNKRNAAPGRVSTERAVKPNQPLFPIISQLINTRYFFPCAIALIYLVMILIVNPIGDFPLNDDWIYAKPVSILLSKHFYYVPDICTPILVFQVYWGAFVCLFSGGVSFTALRISTLLLGLAGAIVFYFLMNDISKSKKISFLAALLVIINPIYFFLANTFMTDVPFLCLTLFSVYSFFKYFDTPKWKFLLLAILFSVCATLIRQFGVVIPIAYGICAAISKKQTIVERLKCFIPAVVTIGILELTLLWLNHIGSAPALSRNTSILDFFSDTKFWSSQIALRCGNVLFYFGLLFFPLLLFTKIASFKKLNSMLLFIVIGILVVISGALILYYHEFPGPDIINSGSMGPMTLSDLGLYNIPGHYVDYFSESTTKLIYAIGYTGSVLLLINLAGMLIKSGKYIKTMFASISPGSRKRLFAALCALGYFLLFLAPFDHFDRYLLPLFPLICLVIVSEVRTKIFLTAPATIITCIFLTVIILFSSYATHDYLAWNRARWQAVDYLTKDQNISIHKIDGGYEVNGWLLGQGREINTHKIWGTVDDNLYMLSFGEMTGCKTVKQFYYKHYYPKANRSIYVLQTRNQ